jgi:hypothetical protein
MKVKVIKTFADKCTYKMYAVGEIIDLPDERASSVVEKGLAESAEVKAETAVKPPKATAKTATKKPVKRATKKKEA